MEGVLGDNNHSMSFIQKCERALTTKPAENNFNGFVLLLYVHGVSRKIGRILKQQKVKVAYKPQLTINNLFHARNQALCTKSVAHSVILCTMAKQKGH